ARAGRPGSRRPTTARAGRRRRLRPRSRRTTSRCRGCARSGPAAETVEDGRARDPARYPREQPAVRRFADLVRPHDERVLAGVAVVALAHADRVEPEAL